MTWCSAIIRVGEDFSRLFALLSLLNMETHLMETVDEIHVHEGKRRQEPLSRGSKPSLLLTIAALFYILLWSSAFIATKIGVTHAICLGL